MRNSLSVALLIASAAATAQPQNTSKVYSTAEEALGHPMMQRLIRNAINWLVTM